VVVEVIQFPALKTLALVTPAILPLVVIHPQFLVMMEIIVQMITVAHLPDVTMKKLIVMIIMLVPTMIAILLLDVLIL
jgi:hypothetical protein